MELIKFFNRNWLLRILGLLILAGINYGIVTTVTEVLSAILH